MPQIHIVGGFLGSGKTTAIAAAAKQLMARGSRVGVVTNDQGRYLVDTLFFRMNKVPSVEVTGGCFCCNYDDFEARLAALNEAEKPDVIFAESVGSCADVVATVIKPMLELSQSGLRPSSLSVFADCRLLQQRIRGLPMPFSEDVVYIFDQQLEEASQILVNKIDLAGDSAVDLLAEVQAYFPGKQVRLQNSLDQDSVASWVRSLESDSLPLPRSLPAIDYEKYGSGEKELAWLDKEVHLLIPPDGPKDWLAGALGRIESGIRQRGWAIGHLKFIVRGDSEQVKISFTTLPSDGWQEPLAGITGGEIRMLINARVAVPEEALDQYIGDSLQAFAARHGVVCTTGSKQSFHPGFPEPTHRI
ncbi:MAG: GTP-binding protein [Xanthomonadales bacterium]|jgi:Ni2+-binding GTPase involved in maturation of urease and hydrogenase|nr:GTP-binding protein [Xanthomonadales bacterium]